MGFPDSSVGKESACNAGDPSSIPGSERSSGEGKGYPLQYSGLANSMECIPWGRKELDATERLSLLFTSVYCRFSFNFVTYCSGNNILNLISLSRILFIP